MAKFKNLHLVLQEEQRILFGDDSLGTPSEYPVTTVGTEKIFVGYTTISGYNTSFPGLGVSNIAATDELVISAAVAGERAVEDYHLVRYDQLKDAIFDEASSDWQDSVLSFETSPPGSPSNGDRYLVEPTASGVWTGLEDYIVEWNTASGTWDTYAPNEGFSTFIEDENKYYVFYDGAWGPMGEGIDHGDLVGLGDDDHTQYVPTDGSRGFTSTVSGIDPTSGYDLVTKDYVDDIISSISGTTTIISGVIYINHSSLLNLGADDHAQYVPTDGSRGFTSTVSGVTPVTGSDLVTKDYVDELTGGDEVVTITGSQTITGDKTFDNTLTTFLGDVFFDGITITMSGTTLETEAGAVFNYDSTATTNNYGDTIFNSGSTATFSGTTNFDSETNFNNNVWFGDNTISGAGNVYAGNLTVTGTLTDTSRKWGRESVINGATNQAVTFAVAFDDDDYTLIATLTNEVDSPPSIYSTIQGVKTSGGFTTHFSGEIDSSNFILEWYAFKGTQDI